jgi:hypothetical protein
MVHPPSAPCRSCRAPLTEQVLDLGRQPASDSFPPADSDVEETRWPLTLWLCSRCALVQLGVDPSLPEAPLAVESETMRRHAAHAGAAVLEQFGLHPGATVTEAASHHGGSWLPHLVAAGLRSLPLSADGQADLVVDVHGLAHAPDTDAALAAHARRLRPDGRLVLEFHHLLPLLRDGQFDTVRHGHPVYLSLLALGPALARHGLAVTSVLQSSAYGGSLRVTARFADLGVAPDASVSRVLHAERQAGVDQAQALRELQAQAGRTERALRDYLVAARAAGRVVLAYGAPSKASVLLCSSDIGAELLPFTADLSPAKQGRRLPGCAVPIRSPEELLAARPDEVLILTWDIAQEVAEQLAVVASWGGRFLVPLPEPHLLPAAGPDGLDSEPAVAG